MENKEKFNESELEKLCEVSGTIFPNRDKKKEVTPV